MNNSIFSFTVMGIPVHVELSFLITCLVLFTLTGSFATGLILTLVFLVSISCHELGHASVLKSLRIPCSIHLVFLGGEARYQQGKVFSNSWEILLNASGIAANILLATLGFILRDAIQIPIIQLFFEFLYQVNVFLALLNIMPVYPLDGGKLLTNLLKYPFGYQKSILISLVVSIAVALPIILYGLNSGNFFLLLIFGMFTMQNAQRLYAIIKYRR